MLNYLYGSFPCGIENSIKYRYFSRYRIEVEDSSIVTTLLGRKMRSFQTQLTKLFIPAQDHCVAQKEDAAHNLSSVISIVQLLIKLVIKKTLGNFQ